MQKILKKQAHLNKELKAVLNTNQLIGKESDPACLIQKACEELIGTMGYFNAWIGLLDEEGRHVKLTGTAGFDRAFDVMRERLHQGVFPCCMQHTLQTNDLVVITDPLAECSDCPLAKIDAEKRNQALLDHSPLCHKIVDLEFNLQYMSANGFKLLELEPNANVYGKLYPFDFFVTA